MNIRQKSIEILRDIDHNKYTQQILRVVAPNFDFDTYKKPIEKDSYFESNTNSDKKISPIKKKH